MAKKKDRSENPPANEVDSSKKSSRKRFNGFTRIFIVGGVVLIAWLLTGTVMQWFVHSALNGRELSRAANLSKITGYLQPWDGEIALAPARCARMGGDLAAWSKFMQPLASQAAVSPAIARELQLGRIQLGEFPEDFHGLMGKMLEVSSTSEVVEAFVVGLMTKHDRENARAILDAWKKDEPQNPQVEYVESIFQDLLGNRRDAIAQLSKFSQLHPQHQPVRLRLANIHLADRRYDLAMAELKVLFSQGDQTTSTQMKLARCYRLQGEVEEAEKILVTLAQSKSDDSTLRELAECQLELGEYAAAAQSLRDAGMDRLAPAEQFHLALADYLNGKPETAASVYASAAQSRQFQSRRADLEVYLILNPDDEKARKELEKLNGQK